MKPDLPASLRRLNDTLLAGGADYSDVLLDAAREIERLGARAESAMVTLRQIADTPRNRGARRNATATMRFLDVMETVHADRTD